MNLRFNVRSTISIGLPMLSRDQLQSVGERAIVYEKDRLSRGLNLQDRPAKPLSDRVEREVYSESAKKMKRRWGKGYATYKSLRHPPAIRNLSFTGAMLASMRVTGVSDKGVRIGFSDRLSYLKAEMNQRLEPQIGLSPQDKEKVMADLRREYLESIRAAFRRAA